MGVSGGGDCSLREPAADRAVAVARECGSRGPAQSPPRLCPRTSWTAQARARGGPEPAAPEPASFPGALSPMGAERWARRWAGGREGPSPGGRGGSGCFLAHSRRRRPDSLRRETPRPARDPEPPLPPPRTQVRTRVSTPAAPPRGRRVPRGPRNGERRPAGRQDLASGDAASSAARIRGAALDPAMRGRALRGSRGKEGLVRVSRRVLGTRERAARARRAEGGCGPAEARGGLRGHLGFVARGEGVQRRTHSSAGSGGARGACGAREGWGQGSGQRLGNRLRERFGGRMASGPPLPRWPKGTGRGAGHPAPPEPQDPPTHASGATETQRRLLSRGQAQGPDRVSPRPREPGGVSGPFPQRRDCSRTYWMELGPLLLATRGPVQGPRPRAAPVSAGP